MLVRRLSKAFVRSLIPPRGRETHKGHYGHVLVVAGSRGLAGAASLCAYGALRGGAGLVTAAVPESQQPAVARNIRPEAMTLALPESKNGDLCPASVPSVLRYVQKRRITALALGPGLSRSPGTRTFVRKLLQALSRTPFSLQAVVLDADGFVCLKSGPGPKNELGKCALPIVVTPHPGEMAQWFGATAAAVQKARMEFAVKFATLNRTVTVLKGSETLITDGGRAFVNATGNPGMATGGSGDVLTGLIAALAAQTRPPLLLNAACAGVFVHGLAGDLAARERTEIGLTALDIAETIPAAFKSLLKK